MRSSASIGVLPAAAGATTLTANATAWANGSYVEFSSSAPSPTSLAGVQLAAPSAGSEFEIGVGVGAAASEVEIACFRTGTAGRRVAPMYLPIPISGLGGFRVAARHRNSNNSSPTITAKLLTVATEDAAITTETAIDSTSTAANAPSITYNGTAWAFSSYTQLTSGLGDPIAVFGICFRDSSAAWDAEYELATGAAASEVTLTALRGYVDGSSSQRWIRLPSVHEVGASTRIAARVRKSGTSTGSTNSVAAIYYSDLINVIPLQRVTQIVKLIGTDEGVDVR